MARIDAAECEKQLREKARVGKENPHYLLKSWDVAEWAVEEIDRLRAEVNQLKKDLDFERSTNDFDAKRLRRLATLVGASTPESDETLLGCAGTVIGSICRMVEGMFKHNDLEREIAYHSARSDIEYYCEGQRHSGPNIGVWYDITTPESDEEQAYTLKATRYLLSRKLLKVHPGNPNLVRPLDIEAPL